MKFQKHAEELIRNIHDQLGEYERTFDEAIERIHRDLEEQRRAAEEQIEGIENKIEAESELAEEQIRKLNEGLENYHREVEDKIQKIHDETEEYERSVEEEVERISEQREHSRETAEGQVERIREQIEHKAESAEEQLDRIRNQVDDYRNKSEEWVDGIRERMDELSEDMDSNSTNVHVKSETWIENSSDFNSVQSLIDRYDSVYNERHGGVSIDNTYVINGVEILRYSGRLLPLSELDGRFPRSEWLQTLEDKSVSIENLDDYCRYLNARDMLMRIHDKPDVWRSGLFDIPATDCWETYEEAFMRNLAHPEKAPNA